ncbi:MAG: maltose alpha-D-glucosyltransferase [Betaproteobacteria bacterium]|nr:maltose alpha-D-glucosyltransferase [Betaproteobacteria bacterium]
MYTGDLNPDPASTASPEPAAAGGDALWYKDAVVYQVHVKAFFDSNNDGTGDFRGLTSKLDYIQDLGVSAVWVLPFYPSPLKDDGYDVADYTDVHPQYGTRADFRQFVREAQRRGLKVITELVVNHTSDQHPWFQAARRAPKGSEKRNWYVWSDTDQKYKGTRIIFTDTEASNWAWDPLAKQYYWHRFFSHQPDLNFENPNVLKAVFRVMRFWADMGVDGFRLDAIPYLCEREGTNNENLPETHAVLKKLRAALDAHYPNRFFLAEANQWPEDVRPYFGEGDECHMAFHFPLMPRMYMAIAQEDRHPLVEILHQTPDIPEICQWAIFLRNHDELTLEMVTSRERDYMYKMYAADRQARINLGIRRRLAPLMENDPQRIRLMNSLLLSMPGSPILYYGDEIGMGDNIYLGDRNGVRTPMQWSPDRNAGFSRCDPQRLFLPPIMDPIYGYEAVNVEAQARDPSSQLNWMKHILAVRNSTRAFGRGKLTFLRPGNRKILSYLRETEGEAILCVANLSRAAQPVELDLKRFKGRVPVEMLGRSAFPPIGDLPYMLSLPAHGFYWFRLSEEAQPPSWHRDVLVDEEAPMLVFFDGWTSLFSDKVVPWRIAMAERLREELEKDVLPAYVARQRWYAAKGQRIERVRLSDWALWQERLLGIVMAGDALYFLPFALAWEESEDERIQALAATTVAKVRQQANVGVLGEAIPDPGFCREVVKAIRDGTSVATEHGTLRFVPAARSREAIGEDVDSLVVSRVHAQSTNTSVTLTAAEGGDRLFLKTYRRVRFGTNPEAEVGRFLTEVAKFSHCVPLLGAVEYVSSNEKDNKATLALLQGYVPNQGDGWTYALNYLERFLEDHRSAANADVAREDPHGAFLTLMETLATRTAELHRAFATRSGDAAFDPEPFTAEDFERWKARVRMEAEQTLVLLKEKSFPQGKVAEKINSLKGPQKSALKTRHHGDYHLGQVLIANNDFVIIDFEGEPSRPLEEGRRKNAPLRDVAGMLRSFSYAKWSALKRLAEAEPAFERLRVLLDQWEAATRAAFVGAYEEAIEGSGLFASLEDAAGMLELAEIEKVLYELRYEAANRPDWLHIPLQGLQALVGVSDR